MGYAIRLTAANLANIGSAVGAARCAASRMLAAMEATWPCALTVAICCVVVWRVSATVCAVRHAR
jgi:hypothetical protein